MLVDVDQHQCIDFALVEYLVLANYIVDIWSKSHLTFVKSESENEIESNIVSKRERIAKRLGEEKEFEWTQEREQKQDI